MKECTASAPEIRASSPVDEQARAVLMTQDFMLKELRQAYDSMKASYAAELARRDHMIAQLGSKQIGRASCRERV